MTRSELIAALKSAKGPDRELDLEVHREAFQWLKTAYISPYSLYDECIRWRRAKDEHAPNSSTWYEDTCGKYTESIDEALYIVDAVKPAANWQLEFWNGGYIASVGVVDLREIDDPPSFPTAPIALLVALFSDA